MDPLTVPTRFRGPAHSGNGGWTAGAAAAYLDPTGRSPVTVTLRRPPPLEQQLTVTGADGELRVHDGDALVLEAAVEAGRSLEPVPAVTATDARDAGSRFAGVSQHPFPGCFVCGTERAPGDGLRIWPGPVVDDGPRARVAATWTPHRDLVEGTAVPLAVAWASLDCAGAWSTDLGDRSAVLGRMTARIGVLPSPEQELVVVGAQRGEDGRKLFTAATLYAGDRVIGTAEHTWLEVDPAVFSG